MIVQAHLSAGPSARFPDSAIIALLAPGINDVQEGLLLSFMPNGARWAKPLVVLGILIITASMFLASFATEAWQITLSLGWLFAFGGNLINHVHLSVFPEWFDQRRTEAMSIIWIGYRLGALGFPLIVQGLLTAHGFQQAIRVLVAPMLVLLLPSIVLLRGRYSAAAVVATPALPPVSKLTALRTPKVLFFLIVTTIYTFVTNVPKLFIAKYAADLGLTKYDEAIAVSLVAVSDMIGSYLLAKLTETIHYEIVISASAISTSVVHTVLWGFARSRYTLFGYAILVGMTSGG